MDLVKDPATHGPRCEGPSSIMDPDLATNNTGMGPKSCIPTDKGVEEETPVIILLNKSNVQLVSIEPPSPRAQDGSTLSASLSLQEIYNCQAACFENSESDGEILDESEILDYKKKSDLSAESKGNTEEKGGHYFVVYPSDEEEDKGEKITKLREEEETCLAVNMSVALCLKKRKWVEGRMNKEEMLAEHKRRKDECDTMQYTSCMLLENSDTVMAEEVGLSMPPPHQ